MNFRAFGSILAIRIFFVTLVTTVKVNQMLYKMEMIGC